MAKSEADLLKTYELYQKLQEAELKQKERVENLFLPDNLEAEPFPEQIEFFSSIASQILLRCGNRAAKTFSNIRNLSWILMRNHPYQSMYNHEKLGIEYRQCKPLSIWLIAPTFDFIMDTIINKYLFQMVPKYYYTDDLGNEMITYHSLPGNPIKTIKFRNGDMIEVKSYSQDLLSLMGRVIDIVVLDELPPDRRIISELVTRTLDCDGRVFCGFTPLIENEEIKEYLDGKCKSGVMQLCSWSILSNPHYRDNPERLARALAEWDSLPPAERNARLNGDWYSEAKHGNVFGDTEITIVDPFDIPEHWRKVRSLDPASRQTGVSFYAEDPGTHTWYMYLSTTIGRKDKGIDADTIYEEVVRIGGERGFVLSIFDNHEGWLGSNPKVQKAGFQPCIMKNVNAGIMATKKVLNSGKLKIFSTNRDAIKQLQNIEWTVDGKPKNKTKYHILDTILYFCRQIPPPSKNPVKPNQVISEQELAAQALTKKILSGTMNKDKPKTTRHYGKKVSKGRRIR